MSMEKIRLTGCDRYNYKGELYEKSKVYLVGESKAAILLRDTDEYGRHYFTSYDAPAKSKTQRVVEAAAAAAAKAVTEEVEAIVERPDGSEPQVAEEVEDQVEQPLEVDQDDDPSLDEEDEANAEEVSVEDEDRDDGSAVEV